MPARLGLPWSELFQLHVIKKVAKIVNQQWNLGLGFVDSSTSAIVLLTCGKGQCTSMKLLRALASRAKKNLYKLPAQQSEED